MSCYDSAQDIGLEFKTWTGIDDTPDCNVRGNFIIKHIVLGKNYRFNKIICNVTGIAMNDHLEFSFRGSINTRWNATMRIPPARPGKVGEQRTEATTRMNASNPAKLENIETIVSYTEVDTQDRVVTMGRIPSMYLRVKVS